MNSTSRSVKRARAHSTTERSASLTITTSDLTPAARKFPITDSINGTPAMGTIGFGTAKPAARSRLPSPAPIMPPGSAGPLTGAPPRPSASGSPGRPGSRDPRPGPPRRPARCGASRRPRPGHVARERVADERRVGGPEPERLERVEEDAGLRLRAADLGRVDEDAEERADPR